MAGDTINTIVDKEAFKQVSDLTEGLKNARLELVELLKTGTGASKNSFNNVKLPSDLDKQLKSSIQFRDKIQVQIENQRLQEIKLDEARKKAFDRYEKQLQNEKAQREAQVKSESNLRQRLAAQKESEQKQEQSAIAKTQKQKEVSFKQEASLSLKKSKQDAVQIENQRILGARAREYAKISSKLSGEYAKQSAVLNKLKREYKDLILAEGETSKEARRLLKNITELDSKLKRVDKSVGEHGRVVGQYGKAWGNVGGIMMSVVSAFGVYSALEIGKQIFSQIKEIDGLNKALKQVVETSEAYSQAQTFIKTLAEETGVEINSLQQAYTKFYASAKTTNLTLAETQNIFRQTAKAGAVLGLSTEEVNGAMKALEQILSKGNVQAEEIRGQLGERLPGAFQILAKSMGLTTAELSKQLKLGNVISDEVLPKFAEELEKTFSLDKVDKVNTLNAAQGRLANSWNEFIRTLDGSQGKITKVFGFLIEQIANTVKGFRILITSAETLNAEGLERTKLEAYKVGIKEIGEESERTGKNIKDVAFESAQAADDRITQIKEEIRLLKEKGKEIKAEGAGGGLVKTLTGGLVGDDSNSEKIYDNIVAIEERQKALALNEGLLKAAEELEDDLIKKIREETGATGELTKREKEHIAWMEKKNALVKGSVEYFEVVKKSLEEEQQKVGRLTKEYKQFEEQIKSVENSIKLVSRTFNNIEALKLTPKEKIELDAFLNTEGITKGMENLSFILEESSSDLMKEFKSSYAWDYQEFLKWSNKKIKQSDIEAAAKKEAIVQWMDISAAAINGIGNLFKTISDGKIQKIDEEIQENEELYDSILQEAEARGSSEEQIQEIEKQKEERRQKLEDKKKLEKEKQARAEKAFAAFQIVINTAASIIEALPNVPLSIAIGALGAIELAAVLATPIPKYKDGRKGGKEELAITGDGGVSEYITDKSGRLKSVSPDKPTYTHLAAGDTVHKDFESFADSMGYDDLVKASIMTSISNQNESLSNRQLENVLDSHLRATRTEVRKGIEDGIKTLKFPKPQPNPDFNAMMRNMMRRDV